MKYLRGFHEKNCRNLFVSRQYRLEILHKLKYIIQASNLSTTYFSIVSRCFVGLVKTRLASVLKTIFTNVSYHITVTSLTLMALKRVMSLRWFFWESTIHVCLSIKKTTHQCVISYTCSKSNSDGSVLRAIRVRLATIIWYDTLVKNCLRTEASLCQNQPHKTPCK